MKALIQRVTRGSVAVDGETVGEVERGFVVLLGVRPADTTDDAKRLAGRTVRLRAFADDEGRMNRDIEDIGGDVLVISQFTLYADTRKGNRPSFVGAAPADDARRLYEKYLDALRRLLGAHRVAAGRFGAHMTVTIVNDGPVTIELTTDATGIP
jgi:D-tyrosyl-tRNA(Tyr) deacylase